MTRAARTDRVQYRVQHDRVFGARTFELLLPMLLAGYLLFNKAFAWFHIPGTNIFVGEIVLAFGLASAFHMLVDRDLWRRSNVLFVWALFAGWSLFRMFPGLFQDPVNAVRDGVLWIYSIVSLAVLSVLLRNSSTLGRWAGLYKKLIPVALLWLPATRIIGGFEDVGTVPDSDVPFNLSNSGDAQVQILMILVFLWGVWVPTSRRQIRMRMLGTVVGLTGLLMLGTSSRGGFVAAVVAGGLFLLIHPRRTRMLLGIGGILIAVTVAVSVIGIRVDLGGRELSASQLASNIASIFTSQPGGSLDSNVDWRWENWGNIWEGVNESVPLQGHGFGPNIAEIYNVPQVDIGLRNAHNSHLTVFARVGWVGFFLWGALWVVWFHETNRTRRRLRDAGFDRLAGLVTWTIVAVTAILVGSMFDPSIEGPQAGFWLWTLFALGIYFTVVTRRRDRSESEGSDLKRSYWSEVDVDGLESDLLRL